MTCRACGSEEEPAYRYSAYGEDIHHRKEHMMRRCKRCGYTWREKCLFQEEPDASKDAQ